MRRGDGKKLLERRGRHDGEVVGRTLGGRNVIVDSSPGTVITTTRRNFPFSGWLALELPSLGLNITPPFPFVMAQMLTKDQG